MVATRTASVFSVIGSSIIVSTFIYFPFFRKRELARIVLVWTQVNPYTAINRLVFYATLGNILTNVATLMSVSVIPKDGESPSGLCELQGLLIQWFMVADSFWVCRPVTARGTSTHAHRSFAWLSMSSWYSSMDTMLDSCGVWRSGTLSSATEFLQYQSSFMCPSITLDVPS